MFFNFFENHFLLKNNWSLISVNRASLSTNFPFFCRWTTTTRSWLGFLSRGLSGLEEGPVNSGPPPLAPEGDQQFSAGCLASELTH